MSRRRTAALLGLAVAAAALAPSVPSALAQTSTACGAPAPVATLDEMSYKLSSPSGSDPRTDAQVPVSISFTNNASLLGQPFDVTGITARLVACDPDLQVLPRPSDHSVTSPDGRTMTLEWAPNAFTTNGQYVVEFEASGNRRPNGQQSRVSAPFSLAVPPQPPADVAATVDAAGKVVVTWSLTGQEKDVGGYIIERAERGSSDYRILETVNYDVARYDDAPTPGEWRYRVYALRAGASPDSAPVRSAPSGDATAEIAVPTPTTTASGSAEAAANGSDSGSGSAPTTTAGAKSSGPVNGGARSTVDLSKFAASLNGRRSTPTPSRPPAPPDPGFSEALPFGAGAPAGGVVEDPGDQQASEQGADDIELGQRIVADDGDRRRSLGFVAGGMLLFVLGMTGMFVKSEVRRVEDLEGLYVLDPVEPVDDDLAAAAVLQVEDPVTEVPDPVAGVPSIPLAESVFAPEPIVSTIGRRSRLARGLAERSAAIAELLASRDAVAILDADAGGAFSDLVDDLGDPVLAPAPAARPTVAPIDAPALDVPDPVPPSRTRTSANARRTPTGLPSRSADDRREGGAVVRLGHRGTGQGDRRLPVR